MHFKTACLLAVGLMDVVTFSWAIHIHRTELHSFKEDLLFGAAAFFALLFFAIMSSHRCCRSRWRSSKNTENTIGRDEFCRVESKYG
ncbi:MAG: hypothetical protein A2745_01745 [Candidatus Harrisonbacteria bacterium RIFCSPHIGHO2_01_FULL_44_13]|uniref:Uncharacterized protein n=1 Tax=Candidatus Harrisonbacteria bacterium RIFCSPLOWO2_01_FULL_44_18 TaxID=1798407 RepID=A0A1G1ZM59_9BACT|nr:MAG: hypothetical protein A2745_01745 [Candidatus Harrisonbacteria bacterium RIFCSPHIGHO2_01_FULL_44_13]OGY65196.1 MAG: hypothetical protein A3A16_00705 [Candidatus Harrisonbacteria bacterium RIFCSPLOWO2_01_FULL_44_18]